MNRHVRRPVRQIAPRMAPCHDDVTKNDKAVNYSLTITSQMLLTLALKSLQWSRGVGWMELVFVLGPEEAGSLP